MDGMLLTILNAMLRDGQLARRPFNVVAAAVANKLARIAWALLSRGEDYRTAAA